MWQAFKDEIENTLLDSHFEDREDYEAWVKGWVEDSINELGRIERYYLAVDNPMEELDIEIGGNNG